MGGLNVAVPMDKIPLAVEALRSFGATRVLLFGSCVADPAHARDLDLAEEGIPFERLGMAELTVHRLLRSPFDLVSREEDPLFFDLVSKKAVTLYEED